jgi:hypothetical protein
VIRPALGGDGARTALVRLGLAGEVRRRPAGLLQEMRVALGGGGGARIVLVPFGLRVPAPELEVTP